jgi:hypothetical protein
MRTEGPPRAPAILLLIVTAAAAAAGDSYRLDRASADHGGGGLAANANYQLVVAIGQHDADVVSSGGGYRYSGGVFAGVPDDVLFKNDFE